MSRAAQPVVPTAPGLRRSDAISTALGGAFALAAAVGVGRFVYTPILPPMVEALHLSKSVAGLIASANFLGYLVGALIAALPFLPGSRRVWLFGALVVSALTTSAMGLTEALPLFLFLRFIGGVASAFALIMASALVLERLANSKHAGLSSLHFGGVGIGIAASAVLVAAMLQAAATWQSLWLASGVLSLAATGAVIVLLRSEANTPHLTVETVPPIGGRGLTQLIIAYGLVGFGYVITATFLVVIVRSTPAVRQLEPVIWVVFGLSVVPSCAFWTGIATPLGIPKTFALACLTEAAGIAISVIWQNELAVFLVAILVGSTFVSLMALGMVRARALTASGSHRVLAWMTSAFGLGQIIGPVFAGVVADRLGNFNVPSIGAALALVAAAVLANC